MPDGTDSFESGQNDGQTVEQWCHWVCDRLEQSAASGDLWFGHGTDNAWDESVWLVAHCVQAGSEDDLNTDDESFPAKLVTPTQSTAIQQLLNERLTSRKPLAYLTGTAWFAGLPFHVDERVIIPRAHLAEWISDGFDPWIPQGTPVNRILDIGTGSGCIAITLALSFPDARVDATDLDDAAIQVARENARRHGVENRTRFYKANVFPPTSDRYDIICSNPPYVDESTYADMPQEYLHEPKIAFVADDSGTHIVHEILRHAADRLSEQGHLFIEVGTARPAIEQRYKDLPITWLASSEEEEVIMMLDRDTLLQHTT